MSVIHSTNRANEAQTSAMTLLEYTNSCFDDFAAYRTKVIFLQYL